MYQTEYNEQMKAPAPGIISSSDYNTVTGIAEGASGIGFGLAVSKGNAGVDKSTVLGGTVAGFKGISVRDVTLDAVAAGSTLLDKYVAPGNMGILQRGQIWVEPGEAVADEDPVYFDGTTGVFYKSASAGRVGPIPGAKFVGSCGVGGRAEVFLAGVNAHGIV